MSQRIPIRPCATLWCPETSFLPATAPGLPIRDRFSAGGHKTNVPAHSTGTLPRYEERRSLLLLVCLLLFHLRLGLLLGALLATLGLRLGRLRLLGLHLLRSLGGSRSRRLSEGARRESQGDRNR